jgi:WbqC-like protein
MKRIAVTQSNYLPWKGYFDLIASVDEFVLFDCVQYTRRDWRNRNAIKTRAGLRWITVPVRAKGRFSQAIDETTIDGDAWITEHLATVRHAYARVPAFAQEFPWLESLLRSAPRTTIAALNRALIEAFCARLGIVTAIRDSREFELPDGRNERLLAICARAGATEYVSGPAAKAYLDPDLFARAGITVRWKSYAGYPPYEQPHPPFEHRVSIVDTLLCTGSAAGQVIRSAETFE